MAEQQNEPITHDERFLDRLEAQAGVVKEGAEALATMLKDIADSARHRDLIKDIEHRGDQNTHAVFHDIRSTMLLPEDRDAIALLASSMDDVVDYAYATANHIHLYGITRVPTELGKLAGTLQRQAHTLSEALAALRDPDARDAVHDKVVEIHALENEADELTNMGKAALFELDDVKEILKLKDVYEYLETATDKCEDAADAIRHLLAKTL